jgi:hypothetical protein
MRKSFIALGSLLALLAFFAFAAAQEIPGFKGKTGFFLQAQGGMTIFLKNTFQVRQGFDLYGETGSFDETYTFASAAVLDAAVGKYFFLGRVMLKAGLGFSTAFRKDTGAFLASIPHPFLMNANRLVAFPSDDLQNKASSVYAFGLFSLVNNETIGLWLGPVFGLGFETINTLNDISFDEKEPYSAADVTVTGMTLNTDSITSFWYGAGLDFEYTFSRNFGLIVSGKLIYDDPRIPSLGKRANFLQSQLALGFQVIF